MTINLSIRKVPLDLARRLREKATANHRSLQGEVLAILEQSAGLRERGGETSRLERQHREGYKAKPSGRKEFQAWHSEQSWGDD